MKNIFGLDFSNFRGDLFGGLTAGIVALPLALAFGVQSGLGAAAGLYGAIFISFFAALFGGTNTQISGPTAPMTAVSMVVIAGIVAAFEGNLEKALPAILIIFLIAGLIQIGLGFIRVGEYIRYIPYPVISGFMSGIGVLIILSQLLPFFGYDVKQDTSYVETFKVEAQENLLQKIHNDELKEGVANIEDYYTNTSELGSQISDAQIIEEATNIASSKAKKPLGSLKTLPRALQNINWIEVLLAALTIFIIYGFKRITTVVPSTLVALIVVSAGAFLILGKTGYRPISKIPSGFPPLRTDIFQGLQLSTISPYLKYSLILAGLGAIDSLLTSIVADNLTKTKHNPNKELVGQGIGNSIAAVFGGIPGAGATIRTVVNINSGGKSKISGMVAGLLLLIMLLALGPLASNIPNAVLAGILITVGIGVMDYKGIRHMGQLPITEVAIMLIVLLLTVFWDLLGAVAIGMILASLLFMKKTSEVVDNRTNTAPLKEFSREIPWNDEGDTIDKIGDKVYIKHLDGPLFFGFASRFQDMIKALPDMSVVVMRMDKVPYVDQSGLYAMEDAIMDLQGQGIQVAFTDLHGQPKDMFKEFNVVPGLVDESLNFKTFADCGHWLEDTFKTDLDFPEDVTGEPEIVEGE
ncbi:MAG: SulP family inorganic anion transporter [Saprospiraceae bacterium]|nr:SulP family inorganic anion transporter [Saprospiraceae bacterium]